MGRATIRQWLMLLGLAALLFAAGCSEQNATPLKLGTNVWPGYEPLYLARDIGVLSQDQIRLVEYPSASEVIRAFRNNSLDAASLTLDEALLLVQSGIPVKVLLVHDISDGGDVIMARPGISNIEQLRGRRVAVESGALGAYVLTRALELHGLGLDEIVTHSIDVNGHTQAYIDNHVDAAVTFEPVRTQLMNQGAVEIFNSSEIPGEIVDVLVVHEQIFKQREKALKHLVESWFEAIEYFASEPRKAAALMARRQKLSTDEVIASFDGLRLPDRAENIRLLDGPEAGLQQTLGKLNRILSERQLLRGPVDIGNMLSGQMVK